MESIMVKGKPVYITDDYDFADILRNEISDDARDYFLYACDPESVLDDLKDDDILKNGYCTGECAKVQETQSHYESILHDVMEKLEEMYNEEDDKRKIGCDFSPATKKRVKAITDLINMINRNL